MINKYLTSNIIRAVYIFTHSVIIVHWISPKHVTVHSMSRRLFKTVNFIYIIELYLFKIVKENGLKKIFSYLFELKNFITYFISGEMPPCNAKNFEFITHAKGIRSKLSISRSQISQSYLYLHSSRKLKKAVICLHSWLPRRKQIVSGQLICIKKF